MLKRSFALLFLIVTLCWIIPANLEAKELFFEKYQKTVVLDPGHGGDNRGAHAPDGRYEKTVALSLARMIATELEGKYRVFLTRTDDYRLDIPERTFFANHQKADLFISIHTGGSFLHQTGGMTVYSYKEILQKRLLEEAYAYDQNLKKSYHLTTWEQLQKRHKADSQVLAKLIQEHLNKKIKYIKTRVEEMPLIILAGADMPAILIEIGYITNPSEEKKMIDPKALSNLAKTIRLGIDDFFSKKNQ